MASGHVGRTHRPNTWAPPTKPAIVKKLLPTGSRPHMGITGLFMLSSSFVDPDLIADS
jgi:hypothetical protein